MKLEVRGVEFVDDGVHELHVKILGSKAVMTFGPAELGLDSNATKADFQAAVFAAMAALARYFDEHPLGDVIESPQEQTGE